MPLNPSSPSRGQGISGRRYHVPPPSYRGPVFTPPPAALEKPAAPPTPMPAEPELLFHTRSDAGARLGEVLGPFRGREDVVVLGIPRGGIVVAAEIARALEVSLDVWISCALRPPGSNAAIGSVSEDGDLVVDEGAVERMRISPNALIEEMRLKREEVKVRAQLYRDGAPPVPLFGKTVIVVDDGIATGATMRGVLKGVMRSQLARCILAAPVAPAEQLEQLQHFANEFAVLATPAGFRTIDSYYVHFRQVTDADVIRALRPHDSAEPESEPATRAA